MLWPDNTDDRVIMICAVTTLLCLLPFPYAFYTLTRIVFFGALLWFGIQAFGRNKRFFYRVTGVLLIVAAIVYNPLLQVHLGSKIIWLFVNLATLYLMWTLRNRAAR